MCNSARRSIVGLLLVGSLAACAAGDMAPQRIDGRNDNSPVGMTLDRRDFEQAAQSMVRDMLASDRLQPRPDNQPRVMVISRITNDTALRINRNDLLQILRRELSRSDRIVVTTAMGLDGPSDPMTMRTREMRQSGEFNQRTVAERGQIIAPDLSLSGEITQISSNVGRGAQRVDYSFQLTLTNIRTGLAVWEGQETVSRIGSAGSVTW